MSENTEEEVKLDRKDLKIRALLETVSNLESKVADLRVDLTLHAQEVQKWQNEFATAQNRVNELESKVTELEWDNSGDDEEPKAEVVQEEEN